MENTKKVQPSNDPKFVVIFKEIQRLSEFEMDLRTFTMNIMGADNPPASPDEYPMPSSLGGFLEVAPSAIGQIEEALRDSLSKLRKTLI